MGREAFLGIERQGFDGFPPHGQPEFPFDQGLDQEGQELQEEEGLNAALVLEQDRGDLQDRLGLLEPLLDRGLALVGF
jgi:hypothetical protein